MNESNQIKIEICPRCLTRGVSVSIKSSKYPVEYITNNNVYHRFGNYVVNEEFGLCGICNKGVIIRTKSGNFKNKPRIEVLPEFNNITPQYLPKNTENYFQQGNDNLSMKNWDAAGIMFRKSLESALKDLFPEQKNMKLYKLINHAYNNGKLTKSLQEWSDGIRLSGNDATHGIEPFKEHEAKQLQNFTRFVLIYLITLPEMLKIAQQIPENNTEL